MFQNVKAILTDIEGTCTSLSFVKDTLFPYSRENMANFVAQYADVEEVSTLLKQVAEEIKDNNPSREQIVSLLRQWIDADLKIPALKALQGYQWQKGYENGDFHGHVYEDAYTAFQQWRNMGIKLYVYSSGSVKAQKLLFSHTHYGDLSEWFSGFFDTAGGAKSEAASYQHISREIGLPPQRILFLSDVESELDAATESGMQVACLQRESDFPCKYFVAKDFSTLEFE